MSAFVRAVRDRLFEDVSTSGRKLAAFDGLRGLAVLTVYLSHSSGFRQRLTPWTSFHGTGHLGVYLFFVLSAFLLASTMFARGKVSFGTFYLRRFFRIAPLFYLIVSVVFALQLATGRIDLYNLYVSDGWLGYFRSLLFIQGNTVFWTIPCEFQFYFLLPLFIWPLLRFGKKAAWALLALALGYGLWGTAAELEYTTIYPRLALIPHHSQFFDVFLFGVLAAWVYTQTGFEKLWQRHRTAFQAGVYVLGLLTLGIVVGWIAEKIGPFGYTALGSNLRLARKLSLPFGALVSLTVLACLCGEPILSRIARWGLLQLMGIVGFSFYLIHFPMIRFANWLYGLPPMAGGVVEWSLREPLAWITGFILTFPVAIALYLFVEKPFMTMSRRLVTTRPNTPQAVAAEAPL